MISNSCILFPFAVGVIQLRARGEQFSTVNTVKHAVNYYSQHAAAAAAAAPGSCSWLLLLLLLLLWPLPLLLLSLKLARDYVARFSTSRMSGISIPDSLLEETAIIIKHLKTFRILF